MSRMYQTGVMTDERIANATQELYQQERRLDTSYTPQEEEADAQEDNDDSIEQESESHHHEEPEEEEKYVASFRSNHKMDNKGGND